MAFLKAENNFEFDIEYFFIEKKQNKIYENNETHVL